MRKHARREYLKWAIKEYESWIAGGEDFSDQSEIGVGMVVGFNMLSIKPANDTEEFYRATAKFNQ